MGRRADRLLPGGKSAALSVCRAAAPAPRLGRRYLRTFRHPRRACGVRPRHRRPVQEKGPQHHGLHEHFSRAGCCGVLCAQYSRRPALLVCQYVWQNLDNSPARFRLPVRAASYKISIIHIAGRKSWQLNTSFAHPAGP